MFYAQLDARGRVHTICQLSNEIQASNAISIEKYDDSLLGSYYDPQTGIFQHIEVSADKTTIKADGIDTAMVTAIVPAVLTEIAFYHADTGEAIATVPVNPATHTATLQVTATTPGTIRIRAGEPTDEPTVTWLNEVVINAT